LPYIVIQVLDYSAATLHAENIKKTLAGFARTGADSELQIFAAIAAPQLKLNTPTRRDAFRARIAREDAANEKAQAAETLRMLKHTWRHTKPAEYIADDYRIVPTLESANFNAYQAESRAREIERRLTNARSARLQFSKAGLPLYKKRTSDFVKFYAPIATAWRALESALDHTEQRSNRLAQMRSIIAAIQENKNDWRARDITFLEGAIHDAITYEQPDAIPPLMNRLHAVYFAKECGATEYAANPDMTGAWLRQTLGHKHKQVTPDDWRNGEGAASYYGSSETLVRRKGDRLETSRGAVAPFSQAVAIFVKAQQCRATGKAWAPNGERYRAGHFELDSIDATGGINIGCHRIEFGEMLRLAVREVPQMVLAAYPVPALV
ncbi:MAG: hypothetical protein ACXWHF_03000, partial [Chthoniobacterales bacterium]